VAHDDYFPGGNGAGTIDACGPARMVNKRDDTQRSEKNACFRCCSRVFAFVETKPSRLEKIGASVFLLFGWYGMSCPPASACPRGRSLYPSRCGMARVGSTENLSRTNRAKEGCSFVGEDVLAVRWTQEPPR